MAWCCFKRFRRFILIILCWMSFKVLFLNCNEDRNWGSTESNEIRIKKNWRKKKQLTNKESRTDFWPLLSDILRLRPGDKNRDIISSVINFLHFVTLTLNFHIILNISAKKHLFDETLPWIQTCVLSVGACTCVCVSVCVVLMTSLSCCRDFFSSNKHPTAAEQPSVFLWLMSQNTFG